MWVAVAKASRAELHFTAGALEATDPQRAQQLRDQVRVRVGVRVRVRVRVRVKGPAARAAALRPGVSPPLSRLFMILVRTIVSRLVRLVGMDYRVIGRCMLWTSSHSQAYAMD